MPGILAGMGFKVELWAGAHEAGTYPSEMAGFGDYPIRLFKTDSTRRRTKEHFSDDMIAYARAFDPDICILKGVDGALGERLVERYLLPEKKRFVFVIGGKYYARHVPEADIVFYETDEQRDGLIAPARWSRRHRVQSERLIRLPKSVDLDLFKPHPDAPIRWDVISVGRLISNYKNYSALGALADVLKVAVVGTGPAEKNLRRKYPRVEWLGGVPNCELPAMLVHARVFMHAGLRDYYPRVLAEAAACGLPRVAFESAIREDVLPGNLGIRLETGNFVNQVVELCRDQERLSRMGLANRQIAVSELGTFSSRSGLEEMMIRMGYSFPSLDR